MPGTAVVDSGNYDLQIATGFNVDAIKLDDAVQGILAGYTTNTSRTNLFPNPNMDATSISTNWQAVKFTLTKSSDFAYNGSFSAKCVVSTGTSGQYFQTIQSFVNLPQVVAGRTYTASAWVYTPATNTADTNFSVSLFFNNGVGYTGANTSTPVTVTRGTWTRISTTATVPAGYFMALPRFNSSTTLAVGQIVYFDACLLEESATALPYFDGSFADPYTGYTLTYQQWASTANASTSTTKWGLTSTFIDSNYVLDGTNQFASVMDSITTITVKRGRRDIGDTFSAGTMTFTIQDVDGVFNPFDENSPYYDTAESKPGLAPMREVKLIRYSSTDVPELLYSGYVVNYDYNFALGGLDTVTVYCADQFYLLAQTYLDEFNPSAETSGARIETVLDLPEVDFPALARDISTGTVNLGHDASYTVNAGTNVLQYITQINDTAEFGRLFMSREGVLTFQDRIGNTLSASVADFHDDGTNYKYNGVGISFEADAVVNRVVVTGLDGKTATATDAGSIATYFIQTNSITNSLLHIQGEIDTAASYLLNPEPEARYTSVETKFLMLTTAQKDTLATLEIGDTITVEKTFSSGAGTTQLAQELSVEGIEHYLDFSTGHRVLYSTSPTVIVFELILDDAVYGTLDELNVLG
jgi:hypothetical protein